MKCVVCGGSKLKLVEKVNRIFKFKIYKCLKCSLFFQHPVPSKQKLGQLYEKIYKKELNLPLAEEAFEYKDERQENARIKEIEKFIKRGALLDVGASTGFFVSTVNKKRNWKAIGIELSAEAVKKAKQLYSVKLIQGEITDPKIKDERFDVITMHSVLDHIPDIDKTIIAVNKKLKKGGYFIFNVTNVGSFEYKFFSLLLKPFPGFIFEHLYYFNSKNITRLLEENGFKVEKLTSRHHSKLTFPSSRPLIGLATFIPKLFLEYTDIGGNLKYGNILYVYARKI